MLFRSYLQKLGFEVAPAEARRYLAGLIGLSEAEQQKALARLAAELGKIQGFPIVSQLEWTAEGGGAAGESREGAPPGAGAPPPNSVRPSASSSAAGRRAGRPRPPAGAAAR